MFFNRKLLWIPAALIVLAGCGGKVAGKAQPETPGRAIQVTLARADLRTIADTYEATGTVRARVTSVLSARVMGYLREVRFQAGDSVKPGQVVAVLDAKEIETGLKQAQAARSEARSVMPEMDNAIAAAKAQLDLANATSKRMQTLFEQRSITNQEFDEVTAKRRMAQANYEMALAKRTQLEQKIRQADEAVAQAAVMKSYTEVLAPFAGTVVERKAEPGMLAAPGTPILVIEQSGGYRLETAVEEAQFGAIRPGVAVKVTLDAFRKEVDARVGEVVPALDPGSRTFTAKIDLPGGLPVRSGMYGRARFPLGEKQALVVPAAVIVEQGQVQRVYVAEGGEARGRLITAGARFDGQAEVLSGLSAGEQVIAPVPAGLEDGSRIEVK